MGQARDGRGRPLPVWQGCRVLAAGEIFVMNRQSADLLTADPETLRDGRIAVRLGSSRCDSRGGTGGLRERQAVSLRVRRHIIPLLGTRRVRISPAPTSSASCVTSHRERPRQTRRLASAAAPSCAVGSARARARSVRSAQSSPMAAKTGSSKPIRLPAHGIRKPAYQKRTRRLSEDEYRLL